MTDKITTIEQADARLAEIDAMMADWRTPRTPSEPEQEPQQPITPVPVVTGVDTSQRPSPRHRAPWEAFGNDSPEVQAAVDAIENYDLTGEWSKRHDDAAIAFQADLDDIEAAEKKAQEKAGERIVGWDY